MLEINGQCHCGKVRFKANVDPSLVRVCHCTDCQITSGGAFRVNLPVEYSDFDLTQGQLKAYIKTADSGAARQLCFCPDCATQIYSSPQPLEAAGKINLRVGTIKQRLQLPPKSEQWTRSKLDWVNIENLSGSFECQLPM